MEFVHDFEQDLTALIHEAEHGEPFAFVRFNDGERAILQNNPIPTADGWTVGNQVMRGMMESALLHGQKRYWKGITCPCCDPEGAAYYRAHVGDDGPGLTFANLFVNGNADRAFQWIRGLAENWCVVSSAWGSDIRVPAVWSDVRALDDYVMGTVLRMRNFRQPLLVAAGPLGKLLIYQYWFNTAEEFRYTIIDIGSVLDPILRGHTRNYHRPDHPNRQKICQW